MSHINVNRTTQSQIQQTETETLETLQKFIQQELNQRQQHQIAELADQLYNLNWDRIGVVEAERRLGYDNLGWKVMTHLQRTGRAIRTPGKGRPSFKRV